MLTNETHLKELQSPLQSIKGRVEIYKGSTLETTCTCDDVLKSFSIEKEGENKFFGFGICQKLSMALMGQNIPLAITKEHDIKVALGAKNEYLYPYPIFHIQKPEKDAETDEITLTAYDALYYATEHRVSDLNLVAPYTIREFATACASYLGVTFGTNVTDSSFNTEYPEGANFEGSERLREALNAIAEATQTIYYINNNNELYFRRLDKTGEAVWTIDRNSYKSLKFNDPYVLGTVSHATALGYNVNPTATIEGVTQYVRDNPFWDLREDIASLVDAAQATIGGLSISPLECEWFGNYLLEPGDKLKLITRNGSAIFSYLLNDSITYSGSLSEATNWTYEDDEAETASNPTSLGEALNQTFAKVDKANKEIQLQAGKVDGNTSAIAALQINTKSISASVTKMEEGVKAASEATNEELANIKKELELKVTAEDVTIEIKKELEDGVDKVTTSTGYTFDENGLSISKEGNTVNTLITNDGMRVFRQGEIEAVLVANNEGVNAENLHATTYLIIGENSRFEDYNNKTRTGCFWIGS